MQVFLANFARAPRWVFTRSVHFIWSSAGRTSRALLLATGVLVLFTWAIDTSARSCSKLAQITTRADNTCWSGKSAKFATQTFVGAIFRSTVLTCYAIFTGFACDIAKSTCFARLAFCATCTGNSTSLTRGTFKRSFRGCFCVGKTIIACSAAVGTIVWVLFPGRAFDAFVLTG